MNPSDNPFRPSSPFYEQAQLPGLEDETPSETVIRQSAVDNRDLERLYDLASGIPRDMGEALDTLNEIRDGIYRLLR